MKKAQLLVSDIGSTITKVSAFASLETEPLLVARRATLTSVQEGDVSLGLERAKKLLVEE